MKRKWKYYWRSLEDLHYFFFTSWAKLRSLKNTFFFWWFFSNLQISIVLTIFLHNMDSLLLKYEMMIFFPDFFLNIHHIFRFLHRMGVLLLKNYLIIFFSWNLSGFRIFPDFHQIFKYILFLSLLYSQSRTLKILSLLLIKS